MFAALNINRNNISNAVSDNLLDDLGLTQSDYVSVLTIYGPFFFSGDMFRFLLAVEPWPNHRSRGLPLRRAPVAAHLQADWSRQLDPRANLHLQRHFCPAVLYAGPNFVSCLQVLDVSVKPLAGERISSNTSSATFQGGFIPWVSPLLSNTSGWRTDLFEETQSFTSAIGIPAHRSVSSPSGPLASELSSPSPNSFRLGLLGSGYLRNYVSSPSPELKLTPPTNFTQPIWPLASLPSGSCQCVASWATRAGGGFSSSSESLSPSNYEGFANTTRGAFTCKRNHPRV